MSMSDERQGRPLMIPSWLLAKLEELNKAIGGQLSLFDETAHPRHGKGSSKGGQFAPKGGVKGGGGGGQPKMPNPATQHGRAQVARMLGQKPPVDDKGRYQSGPLGRKPSAEKQNLIAAAGKRAKQFMAGLDEKKAEQSDDFSQSRALLSSMGYSDEQQDYVLSHFESHGGYDDAEVLWNVHPDIVHDALVGAGEPAGEGADEAKGVSADDKFTAALREFAHNPNPSMPEIDRIAALGNEKQKAALKRATRNAFGGGVPWHWALENEGLLKRGTAEGISDGNG